LGVHNNNHKFSALPGTAAVNYYDKVNEVKFEVKLYGNLSHELSG